MNLPCVPSALLPKKIIAAVARIAQGSPETLHLGNMDIERDWGWAPEYIEAMYLMLQQEQPDDYVIATGKISKLEDFVATAFATVGLNWQDHVISDRSLLRPTDLAISRGNPRKAKEKLGWQARYKMTDIVRMMVENRLEK